MDYIEKVQEAARRLAATKNSKEAYDQCLYDFEMGAYFGYSAAVTRAAEWLQKNADHFLESPCNHDEIVEQFKQAMSNED